MSGFSCPCQGYPDVWVSELRCVFTGPTAFPAVTELECEAHCSGLCLGEAWSPGTQL